MSFNNGLRHGGFLRNAPVNDGYSDSVQGLPGDDAQNTDEQAAGSYSEVFANGSRTPDVPLPGDSPGEGVPAEPEPEEEVPPAPAPAEPVPPQPATAEPETEPAPRQSDVDVEALLKEASDRIGESVLDVLRQVNAHNEEFINQSSRTLASSIQAGELKMAKEFVKMFEHYVSLNKTKQGCGVLEEHPQYQRFQDKMQKSLEMAGITIGTVAVGDLATDPEVEPYIEIINQEKGEPETWNHINSIIDNYYYIYKGTLVKPQKVGIFSKYGTDE